MPYEVIDRPEHRIYVGNVFVDEVVCDKPVRVDGDLITNRIQCPELWLSHGSLICNDIHVTGQLHADILGIYRPGPEAFQLPPQWSAQWFRPYGLDGQKAPSLESTNAVSIANAAVVLTHDDITGGLPYARPFCARAMARPSCGRARVLLAAGVDALWEYKDQVTPFGYQFLDRMVHGQHLPVDWRY